MKPAICVEELGKCFQRFHSEKPITFMEAALTGFRRTRPIEEFWALRGVCFEVAAGEMLGIIGHNGAGKSTLLQLLGNVGHPSHGRIQKHGHVGALLDLGAGFHGDLTGRENVMVSAVVAGLSRREALRQFEQIVSFAELERFIDSPVRTYSSGMMMRLAFSVAIHTNPDILLVDEFLSVGDLSFQTKCLNRITEMKEQGCAIVLVSHNVEQVERLCDRTLWLHNGIVKAYGDSTIVTGQFTIEMRTQTQSRTPRSSPNLTSTDKRLVINQNRFGSLEVEITDVRLKPESTVDTGSSLTVEIDYQSTNLTNRAVFSLSITNERGEAYLDVNTIDNDTPYINLQDKGTLRLVIERLDLTSGEYFINIGVHQENWEYAYDYHWMVYPLIVNSSHNCAGMLCPPMRWEVYNTSAMGSFTP